MAKYRSRLFVALAVILMFASAAWTQPPVSAGGHFFRGRVEQADQQNGKITVAGDEVSGWMAAMTMTYKVDQPAVLKTLKPGDQIAARVYDGDFATLYQLRLARPAASRKAATGSSAGGGIPVKTLAVEESKLDGDADDGTAYVCPMHSDYTSELPGKCPRCGMKLVTTHPYDTRDYHLDFHTSPPIPKAGEPLTLSFQVARPHTGEIIKKFEVVHQKEYHLFLISQDMNYFEHIHPAESEDGTWSVNVKLPKPGYYEVLSDFLPSGGASQFLARPLITAGFRGDLISQSARLVPDSNPSQTVGDLTATVQYDPKPSLAGQYCHLSYHLTKSGTNEPVTDLQTYLGAFGHTLIMSEDMIHYVHSHPIDQLPSDANLEALRGGPDVTFEGLMPMPGRYRAWTQFRYHDKVLTFVNTFQVYDIGERAPK
jgi:Cu/Ag efflux protein CusF